MHTQPTAVASQKKNNDLRILFGAAPDPHSKKGEALTLTALAAILSLSAATAHSANPNALGTSEVGHNPSPATGEGKGAEPASRAYQIAAQSISTALKAFAAQSDMQLIYTEADVGQARTTGVNGKLAPRAALQEILKGTGLQFEFTANNVIVVRKAPSAIANGASNDCSNAPGMRLSSETNTSPRRGEERAREAGRVRESCGPGMSVQPLSPKERGQREGYIRLARAQGERKGERGESGTQTTSSSSQESSKNMKVEEIVVTGSRIARSGFDTPSPMMTIDAGAIGQSGFASVGDVLLETPSIGVGTGTATRGANGASFVNLRGLGTNRSLTLVNGNRRVSGSSSGSAVDLNAIPASMIERIEVITGGSSAVYGADAVSGVVNIILKDDFEGLEVSASGGVSQEGGAENFAVSLHGGTDFANGRGSINFGASYSTTEPLLISERDYDIGAIALDNPAYTGSDDQPLAFLIQDWVFYTRPYSGAFTVDDTLYTYVDGGLRPVAFTPGYGEGIVDSGLHKDPQGWTFKDFAALRNAIDVASFRTNMNFELTDEIEFFAEADFSSMDASDIGGVNLFLGSELTRDNPLLPPQVTALMDANGVDSISVTKSALDYGLMVTESDRNTWTIVNSLKGDFANGWAWRVTGQYGEYTVDSRTPNTVVTANYLNAIDVIADPDTGAPVCRDPASRSAGCVPLNILGRRVESQAALDYIRHARLQTTTNTQRVVSALLSGELLELPSGSLEFAFGLDSRYETISIRDDGLAVQGQLNRIAGQPALDADFEVNEAYLEVLAPLLADKRFFHAVNLEAAARVSDYNTIGRTSAWKVGGDWSPVADVRFRFTRSTSVRAPNLNELFAPRSEVSTFFLDPCQPGLQGVTPNRRANCLALGIPEGTPLAQADSDGVIASGGNPDLTEEESESYTVGVVITPSFVEGLRLSVDYWDITISDAIENLGSGVVERCVDASTIDNPFCPLVTRGSDWTIERVGVIDINVSELTARGVDFEARYGFDALSGRWNVSLLGTKLLEHEALVDPFDPLSLVPSLDLMSHPALRMTLATNYARERWSFSMVNRYIGSRTLDNVVPNFFPPEDQNISAEIYTDLRTTFEVNERYRFYAGVNNLTNIEPPSAWLGGGGGGVNDGALADGIGRFFHGGVTVKF